MSTTSFTVRDEQLDSLHHLGEKNQSYLHQRTVKSFWVVLSQLFHPALTYRRVYQLIQGFEPQGVKHRLFLDTYMSIEVGTLSLG